MTLFRRLNPFQQFGQDYTHPLLSYVIREVRGGRSPAGLARYSRRVMMWIGLLIFSGLPIAIWIFQPRFPGGRGDYWYYGIAWGYWMWMLGISVFLFVIVDLVTLFFAAMSIRTEIGRSVKFDLLRVSPLAPETYIVSRLTLAQVRSWRMFVVMWAGRFFVWMLLLFMGVWGGLILLYEGEISDLPDLTALIVIAGLAVAFLIFSVMFLFEPFWRFQMMAEVAVSVAARVRRGAWMWFALVGAAGLILFAQGAIAVGVVWSSQFLSRVVEHLLRLGDWTSYDVVDALAIAAGFIPWIAMPLVVRVYQQRVTRWRRRVAERFIFARHTEMD